MHHPPKHVGAIGSALIDEFLEFIIHFCGLNPAGFGDDLVF